MAEKISSETQSRMMAGIRGKNTKPELTIRRRLHAEGFRFRLFRRDLPGRPDIALPRWKVVIFVHGCFWHGHEGCSYFRLPKTRSEFWEVKIRRNSERDHETIAKLEEAGWRIAVIWECALRKVPEETLRRLSVFIRSAQQKLEIGPL